MSDLREQAIRSIKNYLADELSDIDKAGSMIPFMHDQAEKLLDMLDGAIEATKNYPMAKDMRGYNNDTKSSNTRLHGKR